MPATQALDTTLAAPEHACAHQSPACAHNGLDTADDAHLDPEAANAPDAHLPEELLVPVTPGPASSGGGIDALKAIGPGGTPVAVAFTSQHALSTFAGLVGLKPGSFTAMAVPAADLLAQLAEASETELCVDPASPTERMLRYTRPSVVSRKANPHGTDFQIRPASPTLLAGHHESLRAAAASLPNIDEVWLLEVTPGAETGATPAKAPAPRPLVVVRQSIPRHHEDFDQAFMELGNRWCETLPRGIAVDMLPHDAPPVEGVLAEGCRLYKRASV